MARYVWCWPVKPGKTDELVLRIEADFNRRQAEPNYSKEVDRVIDAIDLHDYNMWVQRTPHGDYYLNMADVESWDGLWSKFADEIRNGSPHATQIHEMWLETIGIDATSAEPPVPQPILIGETHYASIPENKIFNQAFCFPLLKNREEGRYAFHEMITGKKLAEFEALCRKIGLSSLSRYLLETEAGSFYLVFQEFHIDNYDKVHNFLTNPEMQKRYSWVWEGLVEDTGWTLEELRPNLTFFKEKPPTSVRG